VNAQGVLVMHGPYGARIDAQIDGRGTVMGRYTNFCSYQMVWEKEGSRPYLSTEPALDDGYGDIERDAVAAVAEREFPAIAVSLSAEVVPELRE
jgi:hypothetical protein